MSLNFDGNGFCISYFPENTENDHVVTLAWVFNKVECSFASREHGIFVTVLHL